ncbi:alpha/beta hydrolase [Actinoplanes solisilvae]|uniref:alpha/beta hydrolase n=1 Tax=Actinoplanes solisilvae TaxID=2486853 RepID=UPI000FDB9C94|nr:alpha/beta hydrolase [Actinoplanes solisilvae]
MRAAILTLLLLAFGAATPAQARAAAITWATCPEDGQVQCGSMKVPADWSKPGGPAITLTMARRPATDRAARLGVLLVNPGGPGGSAVDFTLNSTFGEQVRKRFDIVGVDPRGVGRSSPVLCSLDLIDAKPSSLIETEQQYAATIDHNRKLAADCASRSGPVFGHTGTDNVIRDYDAVRSALGENKISFYGASYGTLIGLGYARSHPDRLRALVLDSVMDHSADVGRFLTEETDAAQDSFAEFMKWCRRDARCILRDQDIPELWASAIAKARAGRLPNPYDPPSKLTVGDLLLAAFAAFYEPQWYSFAYYLRDVTTPPASAAPTAPVPTAVPTVPVPTAVPTVPVPTAPATAVPAKHGPAAPVLPTPAARTATTPAPQVDLIDYSFSSVICADWNLSVTGFPDLRRGLEALSVRAPQMLASPLALNAIAACVGLPTPATNPQHPPAPIPGLGPVLLVNARHDPATSYAWARNVATRLGPAASLLTYDGWGHVAYGKSSCVSGLVDKYLLNPAPLPANTACPAVEPQPFGVG